MFGERWNQILCSRGNDVALWFPGGTLTFQALHEAAERLPSRQCPQLGAYYLAQGEGPAVCIALLAGFLSGRPVHVVEADRIRRVPAKQPPAGTALVKQTVGSSGQRRCQFFSWPQISADVDRLAEALSLKERGVAVAAISVAHSYGLTTTLLQLLLHGIPVHWLATPFPTCLTDALSRHDRVFLPGVPAIWKAWLAAGLDLSRVALAVSAGSPLSGTLESRIQEQLGLKLHTLYGTSECGAISYDFDNTPRTNPASLGALLPGVTVRSGPNGRLLVASDAVGLGYDAPAPGEVFGNGEHLTWDVARQIRGSLTFEGCLGSGINVAGRKLSPQEIAERIRAATGVPAIRIEGAPSRDFERVQDVVASVDLPADQLTPAFKTAACQALAPWEVPRRWSSLK